MFRMSGSSTRAALSREYPGADVRARREPGGTVTATARRDDGMFCVTAPAGGMLAYLLGLDIPAAPASACGPAV